MKAQEIKALSVKELKSKAKELREEIFWLKFKNKTGQVEKAGTIRKTQRDLARVLTFLNQKQVGQTPAQKAGE